MNHKDISYYLSRRKLINIINRNLFYKEYNGHWLLYFCPSEEEKIQFQGVNCLFCGNYKYANSFISKCCNYNYANSFISNSCKCFC